MNVIPHRIPQRLRDVWVRPRPGPGAAVRAEPVIEGDRHRDRRVRVARQAPRGKLQVPPVVARLARRVFRQGRPEERVLRQAAVRADMHRRRGHAPGYRPCPPVAVRIGHRVGGRGLCGRLVQRSRPQGAKAEPGVRAHVHRRMRRRIPIGGQRGPSGYGGTVRAAVVVALRRGLVRRRPQVCRRARIGQQIRDLKRHGRAGLGPRGPCDARACAWTPRIRRVRGRDRGASRP